MSDSDATKQELALTELVKRGSKGLHPLDVNISSYEQANWKDDMGIFWTLTLSTDVSMLTKYGINIIKRPDPFISKRGHKAQFKRYWIADEQSARMAIKLINTWREKRGAFPLPHDECTRYLAYYKLDAVDTLQE